MPNEEPVAENTGINKLFYPLDILNGAIALSLFDPITIGGTAHTPLVNALLGATLGAFTAVDVYKRSRTGVGLFENMTYSFFDTIAPAVGKAARELGGAFMRYIGYNGNDGNNGNYIEG